jgi:hypothetical protein
MVNIEEEQRRVPRGRPLKGQPTDPLKILGIIRMRDEKNMRFRVIGEELGMTTQGSSQLYRKWRKWAYTDGGLEEEAA